jgi:hypothetical protein
MKEVPLPGGQFGWTDVGQYDAVVPGKKNLAQLFLLRIIFFFS